jgi:hypothetical protein
VTREELLGEIRGLAYGRLSGDRIEKVISEVRTHLDASLQARLEMVADQEVAESETVDAFGDPIEFVEKIAEKQRSAKREWFDRGVWKALAITTAFFMFFFGYVSSHDELGGVMIVVYFLSIVGFATWIIWASARTKRPQFLPLVAAFALGIPLATLFLSIDHMSMGTWDAGIGMTRAQLDKQIRDNPRTPVNTFLAQKEFLAAADRYYIHADPKKPMAIRWYPSSDYNHLDKFVYSPAASAALADASWKRTFTRAYRNLINEEESGIRIDSDLDEQLRRPFLINALYLLPTGEDISQQTVQFLGLFSLVGWAVSQISQRIRGRRNPMKAEA